MERILSLGTTEVENQMGWSFKGLVMQMVVDTQAIVIAEDWSSWLLVLRGLGWLNVEVLVKRKLRYKQVWKARGLEGVKFRAWSEFKMVFSEDQTEVR